MENWENKLIHVDTPDASVHSHKEALRSKLNTAMPRSRMRASALIASLVLVLGLTGLTVANPDWVENVYRVIATREIRFQSEDGRQIHIKTMECEGMSDSLCRQVLCKDGRPADITWNLDPNDPRGEELLKSGDALKKMFHVDAEVSSEPMEGQQEVQLIISSHDGGQTFVVNGDTVKSLEMIEAIQSQCGAMKQVIESTDGSITTTQSEPEVASAFELKQNYPNPFNPTTQISFELKEAAEVTLKVFDMTGREVATLLNGYQNAGSHSVAFDGSSLASGTYLYTLKAGDFQLSRTMVLVK
ncbi:T9SS type A sorting domain-containing protein [bacterium]|nr:T9SS type A sorting domain-containing protein [bacterium]